MMRPVALASLVLTLGAQALAQSDSKKDAMREAEVKFADGSAVKVLLLQETLEVVTRYGKLSVPMTDVKKIEFGLHVTEELSRKIDDAIRRLGSDTFNQREAAGKELVAIGAPAFAALKAASKSGDQEIANRAKQAVELIRAKVPAGQLRTKLEDVIQANEFPIQGRITATTIKVRTAYFGDLDLKVTELRTIRWTAGGGGEIELLVDASRYSSQEMSQWMDTGITVDPDGKLEISASGQVSLRNGGGPQFITGPGGSMQFQRQNNTPYPPGALIGRIGDSGQLFVVGEKYESSSKPEGKLFLLVAPSPWGDPCSGTFKIKVSGGHKEGGE